MKFISSVARRFAECVDFLDEMNDETRKTQRLHSIELQEQFARNIAEVDRVLRAAAITSPQSKKRDATAQRTLRKRTRAQERHAKLMRQRALLEA